LNTGEYDCDFALSVADPQLTVNQYQKALLIKQQQLISPQLSKGTIGPFNHRNSSTSSRLYTKQTTIASTAMNI